MRTTTERNKDLVPRSNGLEPTGTLTMLIPPSAIHSHRRLPRREAVKRLDAPGLPVAGSRATTQRDPRRARKREVGGEDRVAGGYGHATCPQSPQKQTVLDADSREPVATNPVRQAAVAKHFTAQLW
jgi:hypothetical protein